MRPHAVDHAAPIAAACLNFPRELAQPTTKARDSAVAWGCGEVYCLGFHIAVRLRKQPAPRKRNDPASMAALKESDGRVDHGQSGTKNKKSRVARGAASQRLRPRAKIKRAIVDDALMPTGENRDFGR